MRKHRNTTLKKVLYFLKHHVLKLERKSKGAKNAIKKGVK